MKYFFAITIILSITFVCNVEAARRNVTQTKSVASRNIATVNKCSVGDSRCSYERKDKHTGTTMHFDAYGNLLGKTKP
jgi:hypothetical protein